MKKTFIILIVFAANLYSDDKFSLKAHSAIVKASMNYINPELKMEVNKYIDFILTGAGEYKSNSQYSEDSTKDLFDEIYTCKPISSIEHFYDPYYPNYIPFWNKCKPPYIKSNAINRAKYIYDFVIKYYLKNEKYKAYYYLGRVLHILADLSVPAHAHYTLHPFWPFDDRYERFHKELMLKGEYFNNIEIISYEKFEDYFINIAKETYRYPSDYEDGYSADGKYYYNNRGKVDSNDGFNSTLDNESCNLISERLIPLSISYTTGLLEFFHKDVMRRINEKN
ncbi:MAG: hypothetical protein GX445_02230 [Elusimicrobia bacterium]|nr:hypothetical protein [Elusimicrobiota bacterium]